MMVCLLYRGVSGFLAAGSCVKRWDDRSSTPTAETEHPGMSGSPRFVERWSVGRFSEKL